MDKSHTTAGAADLANDCLLEIHSLAEIVRGLVEPRIGDGLGRSINSMLLRIQRLTELACICADAEPEKNWEMCLEALKAEVQGPTPAGLVPGHSLIR